MVVGWLAAIVLVGGGGEDTQGSGPGDGNDLQPPSTSSTTGDSEDRQNQQNDQQNNEQNDEGEVAQQDPEASQRSGASGQPQAGDGSQNQEQNQQGSEQDSDQPLQEEDIPPAGPREGGDQEGTPVAHGLESTTLPPQEAKKVSQPSNPLLADNPKVDGLSDTDRERMRLAASKFVAAAYGYSGDSEEEYRQGIADTALLTDLYNSPGGERIDEEYAPAIKEDGSDTLAKLQSFEVTSIEDGLAVGEATFTVSSGGEYNRYGELEGGESTEFTQELTLAPYSEIYKVVSASVEQEV
jgi:hypothetical protein